MWGCEKGEREGSAASLEVLKGRGPSTDRLLWMQRRQSLRYGVWGWCRGAVDWVRSLGADTMLTLVPCLMLLCRRVVTMHCWEGAEPCSQ